MKRLVIGLTAVAALAAGAAYFADVMGIDIPNFSSIQAPANPIKPGDAYGVDAKINGPLSEGTNLGKLTRDGHLKEGFSVVCQTDNMTCSLVIVEDTRYGVTNAAVHTLEKYDLLPIGSAEAINLFLGKYLTPGSTTQYLVPPPPTVVHFAVGATDAPAIAPLQGEANPPTMFNYVALSGAQHCIVDRVTYTEGTTLSPFSCAPTQP